LVSSFLLCFLSTRVIFLHFILEAGWQLQTTGRGIAEVLPAESHKGRDAGHDWTQTCETWFAASRAANLTGYFGLQLL
jgi:hypothetical protein